MATGSSGPAPQRCRVARFFFPHLVAGAAIGALIAGGLLLADTLQLRRLVVGDGDAVAIFILGGIMTIAPLALATAIGLLGVQGAPGKEGSRRRGRTRG